MISTPIQIRYSDCDMGGHVHNAAYLNYFEIARIGFFLKEIGKDWNWKEEGIILRKNTIEYHLPIFLEDEIRIEVACNHIGAKSFTLTYSVLDAKNTLKSYGESIVVSFNYIQQKTTLIPEKVRAFLEKHSVKN